MTTEERLIEALRQGDKQALAHLFSVHRERMWCLVNFRLDQRLSGRIDADDVLQEAYLAAAQRIDHFIDGFPHSFFVWLRLVVMQTLVDVHRQHLQVQMRDAKREVSLHQQSPFSQTTSMSLAKHLLGDWTSPSNAAARGELLHQLQQALEGMDATDREVLALRHFEELTNNEVAEVLGIQVKAASIRYIRAIKRLKDILDRLPDFGDDWRSKSK